MVGSQIPEIAPPETATTMIEPGYVGVSIVSDNAVGTAGLLNDGSTSDYCALGLGDSVTVNGHTAADGMRVYLPGSHSNEVEVIDTNDGKKVATITLDNPSSGGSWCAFPFPTIITGDVRVVSRDDYVNIYEMELHNAGIAPHRHNL